MRISTNLVFERGRNALTEQQAEVSLQQLRLASGKKYLSPAEDPSAAVQSLEFTRAIEATNQYLRNGTLAENRLASQESVLVAVGQNIQRVRELAIQAANAPQTDATRGDIAVEIGQRLEELIDLANTQDASGEYLFSGFQSGVRPFSRTAAGVVYNGDSGERSIAVSPERLIRVSDSGRDVFMDLPEGNGGFTIALNPANQGAGVIEVGTVTDPAAYADAAYEIEFTAEDRFTVRDGTGAVVATDVAYTSGADIGILPGISFAIDGAPAVGDRFEIAPAGNRSIFATYEELIGSLRAGAESPVGMARLQTSIGRVLEGFDTALTNMVDVRADLGARLRSLESYREINEDVKLNLEKAKSSVDDLDYAAAITEFQQKLTAFQAAQQSFARIQQLSLFDFLR
ncbi:MAG: flagellar hook-associated protein FlgL [Pseudomonadales bacterium]|jgi:flagellar hook-associated protein 3 FlgL|nr:flagellar hook-associated protein FlgL [Pseudomonadales bacterium]